MIKKHVFALILALFMAGTGIIGTPVAYAGMNTVANIADNYIGLKEHRDAKALSRLFAVTFKKKINPATTPWCAAFVNAVLAKAGIKGTNSLKAASFARWGHRTSSPHRGDIVLINTSRKGTINHVGFFMGYIIRHGIRYVEVLGGNQEGAVRISTYRASRVVSFRTVN